MSADVLDAIWALVTSVDSYRQRFGEEAVGRMAQEMNLSLPDHARLTHATSELRQLLKTLANKRRNSLIQ